MLRKWPGTSEGWFHGEQEDTVLLEFSVGTDSNVNPLLWERGGRNWKSRKYFLLAALAEFQNTYLRNLFFIYFILL